MSRLTQTVAVVALCAVASACNSGSGRPQDPAISLARDIGVALPLAQYDAFADGVIEFAEVESAADRLRTCVSDGGVTIFTFTVGGGGYQASHSGDEGDFRIIERCRVEHFHATYRVFQMQSTPTP